MLLKRTGYCSSFSVTTKMLASDRIEAAFSTYFSFLCSSMDLVALSPNIVWYFRMSLF